MWDYFLCLIQEALIDGVLNESLLYLPKGWEQREEL